MEKKEIANAFEAFKMAKEIAHNEYVDVRAKIHNKWLTDSDIEWRSKGIKLPYPDFPTYPSEHEILKRAQNILDFFNSDQPIITITKEETNNVLPLRSLETEPQEMALSSSAPPLQSMSSGLSPLLPPILQSDVGKDMVEPILLEEPKVDTNSKLEKTEKLSAGKFASKIMNKMYIR
jgi:hypothetical protein